LAQVQPAIDGVGALLELLERGGHASQLGPLRDALSQLQLAFAKQSGGASAAAPPQGPAAPGAEQPASAEGKDAGPGGTPSSGRLWVPGR